MTEATKNMLDKYIFKNKGNKRNLNIDIRAYTMIGALIFIWIVFQFLTDGVYMTPRNLSLLIRQTTITATLTMGVIMVIIAGHIDLSVGSIIGLSGAICAILQVKMGLNPVISIAATLLIGVAIGLWQGYWVAKQYVPAFIVTLGGLMIFRGVLLGITSSRTISPFPSAFKFIGVGYLSQTFGLVLAILVSAILVISKMRERKQRVDYGFEVDKLSIFWMKTVFYCVLIIGGTVFLNIFEGVPIPILIVVILMFIMTFLTTKTKFGRYVYAMGGNVEATKLSGINVQRITMSLFVISAVFASIAGIILSARLNAATTSAGTGAELDAVAAAVIGGTSLMGGVGSVPGAIVGALVMGSLDNGMSLMNVDVFYQQIIKGLILLFAVWFDIKTKIKK